MKRMLVIVSMILLIAQLAEAQEAEVPKVELFGGYSYAGAGLHGWNASVTGNVKSWLGLTADFSGHRGSFSEGNVFTEKQRINSYLFGPRVAFRKRKRVSPFIYSLFGASRISTEETFLGLTERFSDTSFTMVVGGGLDVRVNNRLAIRVFQLDYLRTSFFDQTSHRGRLAFGLVLRLGKK